MLFTGSIVPVSDNSGGVYLNCIKFVGSSKPRFGRIGDVFVSSTRVIKTKHHIKENRRVKKGIIYKAILVRTKKPTFLSDNGYIKFFKNSAVLIKKAQPRTFGGPKLAGNRIFGPLVYNRRLKKKFPKLFALASNVFH
jgi:large subunit ribosomal protein L14